MSHIEATSVNCDDIDTVMSGTSQSDSFTCNTNVETETRTMTISMDALGSALDKAFADRCSQPFEGTLPTEEQIRERQGPNRQVDLPVIECTMLVNTVTDSEGIQWHQAHSTGSASGGNTSAIPVTVRAKLFATTALYNTLGCLCHRRLLKRVEDAEGPYELKLSRDSLSDEWDNPTTTLSLVKTAPGVWRTKEDLLLHGVSFVKEAASAGFVLYCEMEIDERTQQKSLPKAAERWLRLL